MGNLTPDSDDEVKRDVEALNEKGEVEVVRLVDFRPNPARKHSRGRRGRKTTGVTDLQNEYEEERRGKASRYTARMSDRKRRLEKKAKADQAAFVRRGIRTKSSHKKAPDDAPVVGRASEAARRRTDKIAKAREPEFIKKKARQARAKNGREHKSHSVPKPTLDVTYNLPRMVAIFRRTGKLPPRTVRVEDIKASDQSGVDKYQLKQMIEAFLMRGGIKPNPGPDDADYRHASSIKFENLIWSVDPNQGQWRAVFFMDWYGRHWRDRMDVDEFLTLWFMIDSICFCASLGVFSSDVVSDLNWALEPLWRMARFMVADLPVPIPLIGIHPNPGPDPIPREPDVVNVKVKGGEMKVKVPDIEVGKPTPARRKLWGFVCRKTDELCSSYDKVKTMAGGIGSAVKKNRLVGLVCETAKEAFVEAKMAAGSVQNSHIAGVVCQKAKQTCVAVENVAGGVGTVAKVSYVGTLVKSRALIDSLLVRAGVEQNPGMEAGESWTDDEIALSDARDRHYSKGEWRRKTSKKDPDKERLDSKVRQGKKQFNKDSLLKKENMLEKAREKGNEDGDDEKGKQDEQEDEHNVDESHSEPRPAFVVRVGGFARPWYTGFGTPTKRFQLVWCVWLFLVRMYRWVRYSADLPLYDPRNGNVWRPYNADDQERYAPVFKGMVSVAASAFNGTVALTLVSYMIAFAGVVFVFPYLMNALLTVAAAFYMLYVLGWMFRPLARYALGDLIREYGPLHVEPVQPFFLPVMRPPGLRYRKALDNPVIGSVDCCTRTYHDSSSWFVRFWATSWIFGTLYTWLESNRLSGFVVDKTIHVVSLRMVDAIMSGLTRSRLESYYEVEQKARNLASTYDELRLGTGPLRERNIREDSIVYAASRYWANYARDASLGKADVPHSEF